jgi:hypothetical protein
VPEFRRRAPNVAGDDEGAQQGSQRDRLLEGRDLVCEQPDDAAGAQQQRLELPSGVDTRAGPGRGEGGQQDDICEIDGDQIVHLPIQAEQRDRAGTEQMRASPPDHRADFEVLRPHEKQQQPKHRFDGNRYRKQGADLVRHERPPVTISMRSSRGKGDD